MEGKIIFNLEVMHNYDGAEKMGATSCVVLFGEIWKNFESFSLRGFQHVSPESLGVVRKANIEKF